MDSISSFITYFQESLDSKDDEDVGMASCSEAFFNDFINYTPCHLQQLRYSVNNEDFKSFYRQLNDLKYLCIFDEELNRYWFAMRGLSGALAKIDTQGIDNAPKVYQYYVRKYGGRKILRNENWFENSRWIFLDSLSAVRNGTDLANLISHYHIILLFFLDNYDFNLNLFIERIKNSLGLSEDY